MENKKVIFTLCILTFVSMIIVGCRPAPRPIPPVPQTPQEQQTPPAAPAPGVAPEPLEREGEGIGQIGRRVPEGQRMDDPNAPMHMQPNEMGQQGQNLNIRSEQVANELVKLEEVTSATVVIYDNTALVGVNLRGRTQEAMNAEIRRKIENTVRNADPNIDRVSVAADPDTFERIENIARDIATGRPVTGFGRELEDIVRRITPGI